MTYLLRRLCVAAMAFIGLTGCGNARQDCKLDRESLPWNMTEPQFDRYSKELAARALRGEDLCLLDLIQTGRIEDGARSEIVGEAVATIYDGWGTERFAKAVAGYPHYAQDAVAGYVLVARGDAASVALKNTMMNVGR